LEASGVVIALGVNDFTNISESVGLDSESGDHVSDKVLRKIILERNCSHGDIVGSNIGDEKGGSKLEHFFKLCNLYLKKCFQLLVSPTKLARMMRLYLSQGTLIRNP